MNYPDDPRWDMTDAAHPAWWRGYDYGAQTTIREVAALLDGKTNERGISQEPWESLKRRLFTFVNPVVPNEIY